MTAFLVASPLATKRQSRAQNPSWNPVFDSTQYINFGSNLIQIKQEDVAKITALDSLDSKRVGDKGVVYVPPLPGVVASRLFHDLKNACTWCPWVSIAPLTSSLSHCLASMSGPPDTPYAGGIFWLDVQFPNEYPFQPPKMIFLTKVYHPNISKEGEICVDFLGEEWNPCVGVTAVLASVNMLLVQPEWEDAVEREVVGVWKRDRAMFGRTAREWTERFAKQERPGLLNGELIDLDV